MINDYILYYGKGIEHYKRDRFVIHIFIKDKIKKKKSSHPVCCLIYESGLLLLHVILLWICNLVCSSFTLKQIAFLFKERKCHSLMFTQWSAFSCMPKMSYRLCHIWHLDECIFSLNCYWVIFFWNNESSDKSSFIVVFLLIKK